MSPSTRSSRWIAPLVLLVGGVCFTAIWVLLALYLGRQVNWMAWLGAVDAVLMLRFGGMQPGIARSATAAIATLLMAVLAHWFTIASQLGFALGLLPWESALRLGPEHAWTLTRLANGPLDVFHVLAAPVAAAWLARR